MNINDSESQGVSLYTAEQVRELDRLAIEEAGIPGYTLMSRAGEACWQRLQASWPDARSIVVVCGTASLYLPAYAHAWLQKRDAARSQIK
jgi:hypothetical protein